MPESGCSAFNDNYTIFWRRHDLVVSDLTLLQAALFIDGAVQQRPLTSQELAEELLMQYRLARAAGIPTDRRLE